MPWPRKMKLHTIGILNPDSAKLLFDFSLHHWRFTLVSHGLTNGRYALPLLSGA